MPMDTKAQLTLVPNMDTTNEEEKTRKTTQEILTTINTTQYSNKEAEINNGS
jgi:hypothetical protein